VEWEISVSRCGIMISLLTCVDMSFAFKRVWQKLGVLQMLAHGKKDLGDLDRARSGIVRLRSWVFALNWFLEWIPAHRDMPTTAIESAFVAANEAIACVSNCHELLLTGTNITSQVTSLRKASATIALESLLYLECAIGQMVAIALKTLDSHLNQSRKIFPFFSDGLFKWIADKNGYSINLVLDSPWLTFRESYVASYYGPITLVHTPAAAIVRSIDKNANTFNTWFFNEDIYELIDLSFREHAPALQYLPDHKLSGYVAISSNSARSSFEHHKRPVWVDVIIISPHSFDECQVLRMTQPEYHKFVKAILPRINSPGRVLSSASRGGDFNALIKNDTKNRDLDSIWCFRSTIFDHGQKPIWHDIDQQPPNLLLTVAGYDLDRPTFKVTDFMCMQKNIFLRTRFGRIPSSKNIELPLVNPIMIVQKPSISDGRVWELSDESEELLHRTTHFKESTSTPQRTPDRCLIRNYTLQYAGLVYAAIARFWRVRFRPQVAKGYRRLEWKCVGSNISSIRLISLIGKQALTRLIS
jgi:hypothetical protein